MDGDILRAVLCGLLVGLGIYWLLVPDWFVAASTATVYVGAGYFYFAFDTSLFGSDIHFTDRTDSLGYAIGSFGLSTSLIAFADYYGEQGTASFSIVVLLFGVIAFLTFVSKAQQQTEHTR
ncbi:hypothetical protein [Natrinema halophilum]|uniref:Uncharacterized protein n=1 Tax=Natrinema halophilum TaxID=1699371 RepID=A0A7D5KK60_9EURY|nr:hypothetical protein [Natrinema halophilum]QLG48758.1 hypothetical protein HYG82_07815 [Natrinema halophilum]